MPRTLLSCIIGFFSFFAWFGGGSFFQVHGRHSAKESVGGGILLVLYLVLGQLVLPRDSTADIAEDWRVRACMAAPLVPLALLVLVTEGERQFSGQISMLVAGCIGVLLGGLLARSLPRSAQSDAARVTGMSKLLGKAGAALYAGVSVILFALVVPALSGAGRGGMMVVAVIHVVLAAAVLWRTRKGKAPILPATFGFLLTLTLAGIGAAYSTHGSAMRLASIALFVCAAMDVVVCGCCVGAAIRRRDAPLFLEDHP